MLLLKFLRLGFLGGATEGMLPVGNPAKPQPPKRESPHPPDPLFL